MLPGHSHQKLLPGSTEENTLYFTKYSVQALLLAMSGPSTWQKEVFSVLNYLPFPFSTGGLKVYLGQSLTVFFPYA